MRIPEIPSPKSTHDTVRKPKRGMDYAFPIHSFDLLIPGSNWYSNSIRKAFFLEYVPSPFLARSRFLRRRLEIGCFHCPEPLIEEGRIGGPGSGPNNLSQGCAVKLRFLFKMVENQHAPGQAVEAISKLVL